MTSGRAAQAHLGATELAAAPGGAPASPWPLEVPSAGEAEAAIAAELAARLADAGSVVARVAGELTEVERSAFDGLSLADPALLRGAAGLRLRLAIALASAPDRGEFDAGAVQALLASADDVLASLAEESASATEQVAAAIGTMRTELVRDAIRVSEAHQRLANPALARAAPPPVSAAAQVRLLSNESEDAPAARERSRRGVGLWIVLGLVGLAAGGYHVNRAYQLKRATAATVRVDGAPERALATVERTSGQLLFTPPREPLTAAELQHLQSVQQRRGRTVVERAPGVYAIQRSAGPQRP